MESVNDRVKALLAEQIGLDPEEITPEASLVEDLGADSLDCIEIVMACEEKFEIEISDEDAQNLKTVADVMTYLERRGVK